MKVGGERMAFNSLKLFLFPPYNTVAMSTNAMTFRFFQSTLNLWVSDQT